MEETPRLDGAMARPPQSAPRSRASRLGVSPGSPPKPPTTSARSESKVMSTMGPPAGGLPPRHAAPRRRPRRPRTRSESEPRRGLASPGLGIELTVAVRQHQDALDVDLRLLDPEVFEEAVHLGAARLVPEPLDAVRAAVVAGQRKLQVLAEHAVHLTEVGGAQPDVERRIGQQVGRVGEAVGQREPPGRLADELD